MNIPRISFSNHPPHSVEIGPGLYSLPEIEDYPPAQQARMREAATKIAAEMSEIYERLEKQEAQSQDTFTKTGSPNQPEPKQKS